MFLVEHASAADTGDAQHPDPAHLVSSLQSKAARADTVGRGSIARGSTKI